MSDNPDSPDYNPPGYDEKKDYVELVKYDFAWIELAKREINRITASLNLEEIVDIQHIGSTAIPGIVAKPIIDILIGVSDLSTITSVAVAALEKLDYHYWRGNPNPDKLFFVKGTPPFGDKRTHHVHIVRHNSDEWLNRVHFRDYLIEHPLIASQYEELKYILAARHEYDRERYTREKATFIKGIACLRK